MASTNPGTGLGAGISGFVSKLELVPFTAVDLAFLTALDAGSFLVATFFTVAGLTTVDFLVDDDFLAVKLTTETADTG
jgi:hypothetical protein